MLTNNDPQGVSAEVVGTPQLVMSRARFFDNDYPGVEAVQAYCDRIVLKLRGDGNCQFSAEVFAALLKACHSKQTMSAFVAALKTVFFTSAYRDLVEEAKVTRICLFVLLRQVE